MTDFLFSLACIAPLVALFVRGSRHEMFTPTRYAFTPQMLDMFYGENPIAVILRNSQVRR